MASLCCNACLVSSRVQGAVSLPDQWQGRTPLQPARAANRQPHRRCSRRSASAQLGLAATAAVAPAAAAGLRSSTQQLLEAGSQQLQGLQLPTADGLQLPADIDAGTVAASAAEVSEGEGGRQAGLALSRSTCGSSCCHCATEPFQPYRLAFAQRPPLVVPPQALGTAAEGLASAAQRALAPLDVFSGNLLLDLGFWICLFLIAYSVVVLGPRQ